jgi:hypothetical protein
MVRRRHRGAVSEAFSPIGAVETWQNTGKDPSSFRIFFRTVACTFLWVSVGVAGGFLWFLAENKGFTWPDISAEILLWFAGGLLGSVFFVAWLCATFRKAMKEFVWEYCFGPGALGGTIGLISAAGIFLVFCYCAIASIDNMVFGILAGSACAWAGGMLGGVTARHEELRPDWELFRGTVGFISGAIVGGYFAAHLCNLWVFLVGVIGGSLGGLADAVVHRATLEEGD